MNNNIKLITLFIASFFFNNEAFSGGCTPITNGTCATAVSLTAGASCTNGSSCSGGSPDAAGSCLAAGSECSWYSFTATATDMVVIIDNTVGGVTCYQTSSVYSGSCGSLTELDCTSGAPIDDTHGLTGLTISNTYYIQICYGAGGPCGDETTFCIEAAEPDPPCDDCSTPCGTAAGYASLPAVQTVVDDCQTQPFVPELAASSTNTFCYSFQATNASVDFNVIITSNCGAGNVTNFSWELFDYPSCGSAIQTGSLASLTFSGLTVGNLYVFCYTFDVPSTCTHTQHCPFFVGAIPLSQDILNFEATLIENRKVELNWDYDFNGGSYFEIQRNENDKGFEKIELMTIKNSETNYYYTDNKYSPLSKYANYRIKKVDYDGNVSYSESIKIDFSNNEPYKAIFNNKRLSIEFFNDNESVFNVVIYSYNGQLLVNETNQVNKGLFNETYDLSHLSNGIYFVRMNINGVIYNKKIIIN